MSAIGRLIRLGMLASASLAVTACNAASAPASSGPPDLSNLRDFDAVTLAGPDRVVITRGSTFSVKAEGDPKALARLEIGVRDHELRIGRKRNWSDGLGSDRGATITVTLPALRAASLTGSGDMNVDILSGREAEADVTGSGDLVIARVEADELDLDATGSGTITVAGKVRSADIDVTGSGDIRADKLAIEAADVSIMGSGNVAAHVSQQSKVSIMGSGDATISGGGRCSVSRMGSGEARCG